MILCLFAIFQVFNMTVLYKLADGKTANVTLIEKDSSDNFYLNDLLILECTQKFRMASQRQRNVTSFGEPDRIRLKRGFSSADEWSSKRRRQALETTQTNPDLGSSRSDELDNMRGDFREDLGGQMRNSLQRNFVGGGGNFGQTQNEIVSGSGDTANGESISYVRSYEFGGRPRHRSGRCRMRGGSYVCWR